MFNLFWLALFLLNACNHTSVNIENERKELAEQFFRGIYGCNPSVVDDLAGEDIVISYPIFQKLFDAPALRGRNAVMDFATGFCSRWTDAEITIHETVAEGDKVVLLWSFQARSVVSADNNLPPANQEQHWGGITLFRFDKANKIVAEIGEESDPGPFERVGAETSEETHRIANIKELHQKYMTASIDQDIETLIEMTHEEIVWQLGPYTLKGKEAALGPNKYDVGTGAVLEYGNVVIRGDTVEFELVERNQILAVIGMESIRLYPRFVFKNGLVYRKESWKTSPDIQEMNRLARPLRDWKKEVHPEIVNAIFDTDGNFIFNRENGELNVQMALEWKQAMQGRK